MQNVSTRVKEILSNGNVTLFLLTSFYSGTNSYNFTSLPYELIVNGELYLPDRNTVSIAPPKLGASLDREEFSMKLGALDKDFMDGLETSYLVTRLRVVLGVIDPDTGKPLVGDDDLLVLHDGVLDTIETSLEAGEVSIGITSASPMADFDTVKTYITEPRYQKDIMPEDTCYDFVAGRDREITMKWGK